MDGLAPASPVTGPQFDNRRVLAALIDIALLVPVVLLMSALFDGFTGPAPLLTMAWALYYYFALESAHGQTIGKRVMKIRVVRADGKPLDTGRAAVRTLLRPIDGIFAYLVGLVVMLATGHRRQRLGDLAAGTVVTDAGAPVTEEPVVEAAEAPEAPVVEPPAIDAPPPLAEERMADTDLPASMVPEVRPFDPVVEPEPKPESVVEPEPAPAPEDIVPVDRPEDPAPPTDEPVPVPEPESEADPQPEPEPMEIVTSPIDLVMEDHDEEPQPPQA